jgi:hypothetical protein
MCDDPLSNFAFEFNLRRYTMVSCCRPAGGQVITGKAQHNSIRSKCHANILIFHIFLS